MRLFIGALFTASLSLVACGGGGDDRVLSELSDSDFVELCNDFDSGLSDAEIAGLVGFDCLLDEAFSQDGCMQARLDSCIDAGIAAWEGLECTAPEADDPIRSCGATVDTFSSCFEAQYAVYTDLSDATCADLESFDPALPSACEPLQTECPDIFGEDA